MAFKYEINGQVIEFDKEPTTEDIDFAASQLGGEQVSQGQRERARPEEFLTGGERVSTGFRVEPEKFLARRREELGLAPGTPLEPTPGTASFIENIRDIPLDVADMIGPAFPVLGQILGGIGGAVASTPTGGVAAPAAIAAGGVGGAAGGEIARQAVGEFFNLEDKGLGDRAKRVLMEGAFGALGEGIALGGNALLKTTKRGIIKAGEKLLSKGGIEKFAKHFSTITRKLDPEKFNFALKATRVGDDTIYKKEFAERAFSNKFVDNLLFGKSNNAMKQIKNLARKREAFVPIKELYKKYLGVSDEAVEMAIKHGSKLESIGTSKSILNSMKQINRKIPDMFDDVGKRLGKERNLLAKQAGQVDVSDLVSQVNKQLGDELAAKSGMLNIVGDGIYEINPSFAVTSQGRTQAKSFIDIITKFFGKQGTGISSAKEVALKKAIINGDEALIKKITRGKFFTSKVSSNFEDFIGKLKSFDVQISGKEFESLGKLSPELTVYLQGLRGITDTVADRVGNVSVKALNQEFKTLVKNASLLREGSKVKNVSQLEDVLFKYVKPSNITEEIESKQLHQFLKKNVGTDVFNNIKAYKAFKEFDGISTKFKTSAKKQSLVNIMENAFSPGNSEALTLLREFVDPVLSDTLKPGLNAMRHTTAKAIHDDSVSLLKARFLAAGLGIGGLFGGFGGATAGLLGGISLQNPKLLQLLLRKAGKAPTKAAIDFAVPQVKRGATIGGAQLLKTLLQKSNP